MRRLIACVCLVCLVFGAACASTGRPGAPVAPGTAPADAPPAADTPNWTASPPAGAAPGSPAPLAPGLTESIDRLAALRVELQRLFGAPALQHALWAVDIQSLATDEVLFELNPAKLVMPASNMKIVTIAAAAERLGWEYRYETRLVTSGTTTKGVLHGDLVIVGSGDPTISGRGGVRTRVFDSWAEQLRASGIVEIDGRIVGDDNLFDDEGIGAGWSWDYLAYGYAAPTGALQFNEDTVELRIHPGQTPGDPVHLAVEPPDSGLTIVNRLVTTPVSGAFSIELRRTPRSYTLEVIGSVPAGTEEFTRTASIDNPTEFFARALRASLVASGIRVRGDAVDLDTLDASAAGDEPQVLVRHLSPPLSEIAAVLMKVSQNLYGDTLLKTLGTQGGSGTAEDGRKVVRDVLASWDIPEDSYVLYDGSGLSRYNYVTAEMLVKILRHLYQDERHRDAFEASLPIAGQDGTLKTRMKNTRAEGNARAKTGSIANVRALSGYVNTADGEPLAFSIIANNFNLPQAAVDSVVDLAVERLANFSRVPPATTAHSGNPR